MSTKIVLVSEAAAANGKAPFRWLADRLDRRLTWHIVSSVEYRGLGHLPKPYFAAFAACFRAVRTAKKTNADLIVSIDPLMSILVGILRRILRVDCPQLAWDFGISYWTTIGALQKKAILFATRNIDRFVVFSSPQAELYPKYLDVEKSRFQFIHWGVQPPQYDENAPPLVTGEYIAAMGGMGRNYATLIDAVRPLKNVKLVLVVRPENLQGIDLPDNVEVFTNIPYPDAMNIALHSQFMALPIATGIPTGHSSLVAQFWLNKATIVTRMDTMKDYALPEENVLEYEADNTSSLRAAIERLLTEPELRDRLAANGLKFAQKYCTEAHTIDWFHDYLRQKNILPKEIAPTEKS